MPTPKRIFYGCLGVARCDGSPMGKHISVSLSVSRNISNIMSAGNKTPAITYPDATNVELTTTQYYSGFITDLNSEPGVTSPIGLDVMLGDETQLDANDLIFLKGSTARTVRCKNMFLNNISYQFVIDGPFITTKKYSGWIISNCTNSSDFAGALDAIVPIRRHFVPGAIGGFPSTHLSSVNFEQSINRQYVVEFASRANYAAYMVLPIKASLSLEGFASCTSAGYSFQDIATACNNFADTKEVLTISTCGPATSSISLPKSRLVSLGYSGGDANSSSNMMVSASYESIIDATPIQTTWTAADSDHDKEDCDC